MASCTIEQPNSVTSPNSNVRISFSLSENGTPQYQVAYRNQTLIDPSSLGFEFKNSGSLNSNFSIESTHTRSVDETWNPVWGENSEVENRFNELLVELQEQSEPYRRLHLRFRAYDDGIGFRYEIPLQQNLTDTLFITDELTEFKLKGDHDTWWIPGDWDIYEHLYNTTKFSEIDATSKRDHPNLAQTYIPENAVNTPVTMKTAEGLYLSFHEADLTDYAGMTLKVDTANMSMTSNLVGSQRRDYKVERKAPFNSPWRTIQIGEKAGDLIESNLIVNLNDPNELGDIPWFKPTKYVGIWWEMHLGKSTWDYESGRHGATTENTKRYIDFAADNNIGAVLVEGWNTGWERWIGFPDREGVFDFVTPYPDYDLQEVMGYAKEKGVEIIMHHETSAAPRTYEAQLDTAYSLMQDLGIHVVKTGYVGKIIPEGEYHHGQWMVNHYRKVLEKAAEYEIAVNAHEPIKGTGIRRTLPNAISREGLRGQEYNAWSVEGGNPPEHLTIVPFTRMLAGPIDFTPGIFNIKFDEYQENNQVNTTLAQQLALYVVLYSPVQMAADLPEHYEGNPAFQFIREVAVNWDESHVLNGEIGEYVTIARKEKDSDNWFVGSVTDEESRSLEVTLDFLDPDMTYRAVIYRDGEDAHWDDNPLSIEIDEQEVTNETVLEFDLAPGGGQAISIFPVKE
ncbi:glycoside hydrolase family 97 protein [Balneolaceae bacterium YR4-1]|uniref:Glycoside hydrolase family 97 protein n=1 Tax=Halalkalibaculum roseum TaxID=2709311 RepID=A0A6M1SVI2_9BACT|nr:glycoside hydrolase family 97 protein [Halalkalibaculum roseum]NGP76862.1 glycoside hydrolase family 97 protein [Halalkalibaculum roseum]